MNAGDLSAREYLVELEQDRAELDVLITALRKRLNGTAPAAAMVLDPVRATRAAKRAPTSAPARNTGGRSQVSDAQLALMRREWEQGLPVTQIAKHAKVSEPTVRSRAEAGGWKRSTPPAMKPKPVPQPKGEQLAGSVKCTNPDCGVMTDYDPCRRCGKKLNRKGW